VNKLTVVIGEASREKKMQFGLVNMGEGIQFPVLLDHNEKEYIIIDSTEGIDDSTIISSLECLEDHLNNTYLIDWTKEFSDENYTIAYGTYYGQNIQILVYIIK
jgi:hypothetical protein